MLHATHTCFLFNVSGWPEQQVQAFREKRCLPSRLGEQRVVPAILSSLPEDPGPCRSPKAPRTLRHGIQESIRRLPSVSGIAGASPLSFRSQNQAVIPVAGRTLPSAFHKHASPSRCHRHEGMRQTAPTVRPRKICSRGNATLPRKAYILRQS